jgi:hypothetical protein
MAQATQLTYTGTGTQGMAVTNVVTSTPNQEALSVFWNDNDTVKTLLYGSSFVEIPNQSGSGTSLVNVAKTMIFDVNNDIDAIGDLVLKVAVTSSNGTARCATGPLDAVKLIDHIDFYVGSVIWQTLQGNDLLALASTELPKGSFDDFALQASGGVSNDGAYTNNGVDSNGRFDAPDGIIAYLPLKLLNKTLGPQLEHIAEHTECGFLKAAATGQNIKIKVVTNGGVGTNFITGSDGSGNGGFGPAGTATVDLALYGKHQVMTINERTSLNNTATGTTGGMPKRIKTTQNINKEFSGTAGSAVCTVTCDSFNIYASHLLITVNGTAGALANASTKGEVELLLNGSTYSSKLPMGLLRMVGSSMGLYTNEYTINETDRSSHVVYVFPLASRAYSGSGVPLNKFDSVTLKFTQLPYTSGNINVTCVGEQTAKYFGTTAALAVF